MSIPLFSAISAAPPAETVSAEASVAISCTYSGTNNPDTVQWRVAGIVKTSDDTGFTGFAVETNTFDVGSKERLVFFFTI